jgi:hypothetical protein
VRRTNNWANKEEVAPMHDEEDTEADINDAVSRYFETYDLN